MARSPSTWHPANVPEQSFKPRYPVDPFGPNPTSDVKYSPISRDPWKLDLDKIPPLQLTQLQQSVILALGEITLHSLLPLFRSPHLASSLLVIASYEPLRIPTRVFPTVRILRLKEPLSVENAGAERLVRTLEWAERVARVWRNLGGIGVSELLEPGDEKVRSPVSGAERPRSIFGLMDDDDATGVHMRSRTVPSSPTSPTPVTRFTHSRTPSAERESLRSIRGNSPRLSKMLRDPSFLPPEDHSQRPFDAILNFLPSTGIPDGYLLKNAILVTTISRPFLIARSADPVEGLYHANSPPSTINKNRERAQSLQSRPPPARRRWSLFKQSDSTPSMEKLTLPNSAASSSTTLTSSKPVSRIGSTAPSTVRLSSLQSLPSMEMSMKMTNTNPSVIIHVLPSPPLHPHNSTYTTKQTAAKERLVYSLETFLLSFGMDMSMISVSGEDKRAFDGGIIKRARPYLVDAGSFANDVISAEEGGEEWSLAELLVCGCLDVRCDIGRGKDKSGVASGTRVWLRGIGDIVLTSARYAQPNSTQVQMPSPVHLAEQPDHRELDEFARQTIRSVPRQPQPQPQPPSQLPSQAQYQSTLTVSSDNIELPPRSSPSPNGSVHSVPSSHSHSHVSPIVNSSPDINQKSNGEYDPYAESSPRREAVYTTLEVDLPPPPLPSKEPYIPSPPSGFRKVTGRVGSSPSVEMVGGGGTKRGRWKFWK